MVPEARDVALGSAWSEEFVCCCIAQRACPHPPFPPSSPHWSAAEMKGDMACVTALGAFGWFSAAFALQLQSPSAEQGCCQWTDLVISDRDGGEAPPVRASALAAGCRGREVWGLPEATACH